MLRTIFLLAFSLIFIFQLKMQIEQFIFTLKLKQRNFIHHGNIIPQNYPY